MTVKQAAAKFGTTRQTIYNYLKGAGFDSFTDPETHELTEKALEFLESKFSQEQGPIVKDRVIKVKIEDLSKELDTLNAEKAALTATIDALTDQNNRLQIQLDSLTTERDFLRASLAAAQRATDQAQQLQARQLDTLKKLLPEATQRRGPIAWIRDHLTKPQQPQEPPQV